MHETPLPRLSRRRFLTRSLLTGLGLVALPGVGALAACSSEPPEPDERLLAVLGALRALTGSTAGPESFFSTQAERVSAEIVRQCGTEPSSTCTASVNNVEVPAEVPTVAAVREQMTGILPDAADQDQAALVAGLFAALATVDDKTSGAAAIDWSTVDAEVTDTPGSLEDATARIHEAVWLTGRVLPTAGASASTVTTVAERLRRVRDAAVAATGVPAAAGYSFPPGSGAPTDAAGSAALLLSAVHAVTVDLRRAVGDAPGSVRPTLAMWCAVSARCEAALEDALGRDPLAVAVRGE